MKRIMISGTGSGCGKTTVTCAVLQALVNRKTSVASFKAGPDYIDPMFHRSIIGTPSHNLDPFFCGKDALCSLLEKYGAAFNVVEGAMGFYDGGELSAYSVSQMTETPVVLVLNCRGMRESLGAVMQGFLHYKPTHRIAGFIFNRLPLSLVSFAEQLCESLGTVYFGAFPTISFSMESRHLGLVTAEEIVGLKENMQELAHLAEEHLCLDKILKLQCPALPDFTFAPPAMICRNHPVIAVARDEAFSFLYAENLDTLRDIGCDICFFSPLHDHSLPLCDGLYLPGGYPELYAQALSENLSMKTAVRSALEAGMPCIAECGGFLYLHRHLQNAEGKSFPMVGIFAGDAFPTNHLRRFGYAALHSSASHMLAASGETLSAHEFHYWESSDPGTALHAVKPDGRTWDCVHVNQQLYAGFPHLYWYADPEPAERFAKACELFREKQNGTTQSDSTTRSECLSESQKQMGQHR